jgi:hypothetical protein
MLLAVYTEKFCENQGLKEQVRIAMAIVEICITKPNLVAECESCSA